MILVDNNKRSILENSVILRRFAIIFFAISFLPFMLVFFFYNQLDTAGLIDNKYVVGLLLTVIGMCIAYWGMRMVLRDLLNVVKVHTEKLGKLLGTEKFRELTQGRNEIAILANTFDEVIRQMEDNVRRLEMTKNTLHSVLRKVGKGLSSIDNIDSFLDLILGTVVDALSAKKGVLLLLDAKEDVLTLKAIHGFDTSMGNGFAVKPGNLRAIIQNKKPEVITHFERGEIPIDLEKILFPGPFLCAPMLSHDKVRGLILIGAREESRLTDDELNLLFNIALQTAVAVENSQLNENAEKTYFETISALALAVEAKDPYSRGHLDRVAQYAQKISENLGLGEEERLMLRGAARLHDIGKIGILDEVLRKPERLTQEEYELMKKHPAIGEGIIAPLRSLRNLCDIVRHHHELLDGSGYPDGLKGDQITLMVRVLTVADIFDALTTTRPYRQAMGKQEALRFMTEEYREKLDQRVLTAFRAIV